MPDECYTYNKKKYKIYLTHWNKWKDRLALEMYSEPFDWLPPAYVYMVIDEYKKRTANNMI